MWKSAKHKIIFEKLLKSEINWSKESFAVDTIELHFISLLFKMSIKKKKFLIQYLFVKTFVQQS